jgi:AraC-like DNA-binding protein
MSASQLLRKIKALTNQTSNEFIRDFRLQRAATLLEKKSGTVSEIAFDVGFENLSYFSKVFQEKYGKLPSEY